MKILTKILTLLVLLSLFTFVTAQEYQPAKGYHNYKQLTAAIKELASGNKNIIKLTSIGKTEKNRDIWAMTISGEKGGPLEKQALMICGNLEGDHLVGSEVALGIATYLANGYGSDEEVTAILDKRTFYIIPRLNPDGAEFFFENVLMDRTKNSRPRDEDYDWQIDEDPPEDLNGDGMITLMRVKDKEGEWYIDKDDPRLMIKKEENTPLDSLYKIYPEGIDNDGDELYNEDNPGGFNINRNFPHNFGYDIKGYKVYPASENETRALIDFLNRYDPEFETAPHKNICGMLIFSKYDNLAASPVIECGEPDFPEFEREEGESQEMTFRFGRRRSEGGDQRPAKDPQPKETAREDKYIFEKMSDKYKEITGIKDAMSEKPVGSALEWGYFQYGVPTFSANLWSLRKEKPDTTEKIEKKEKKSEPKAENRRAMMMEKMGRSGDKSKKKSDNTDARWLKWIDKENNGLGFVQWQEYQHSQLGKVEIGGFFPYIRTNPPAELIDSLTQSHAKFALYLASQFAEIIMEEPEVEKMSSNLFRLKIKVKNAGKLPYACEMGQKSRNINPVHVQLVFEDDKDMKLFGGSKREHLSSLKPSEEKEFEWVIISPAGKKIDLKLWAQNGGGTIKKKIVLR